MGKPVILYDGFCNLCNFSTRLILKLDRKKQFDFIPLQSPEGQKLTASINNLPDTVILYFNNELYCKSDALIMVASIIGFPLNIVIVLKLIPKVVRDYIYMLIAKNRYRLFGKKDYCQLNPTDKKKRPKYWSPFKYD